MNNIHTIDIINDVYGPYILCVLFILCVGLTYPILAYPGKGICVCWGGGGGGGVHGWVWVHGVSE